MAKKKVIIIPYVNTSPWLCTFNDLMTLLLTFFVLILSMSSLNASKVKNLQAELIDALGVMEYGKSEDEPVIDRLFKLEDMGHRQKIIKTVPTLEKQAKQIEDLVVAEIPPELQLKEFVVLQQEGQKEQNEKEIIFKQFEKLINENFFEPGITVIKRERGVVLRLNEKVLFSTGGTQLKKSSYKTLAKIAPIIRKTSLKISIEGHTDSESIKSEIFPSNWELSIERAFSVLDFYINKNNFDPEKFYVSGFADSLPITDNKSPENRAKNRRIELVFSKM